MTICARAFDVHALDYLVKPCTLSGFNRRYDALALSFAGIRPGSSSATYCGAARSKIAPKSRLTVAIKAEGRIISWGCQKLIGEAAYNYVKVHVGNQAHMLRQTMGGSGNQINLATDSSH